MPTNTPDQQITVPIGGDAANNPAAFLAQIADVETRLVLKYTDEADRTARHTAPVEGDLTGLATENRYDTYDGANYVSTFTRSLFTHVERVTDATTITSGTTGTTLVSDSVLVSALPTAGRFNWEVVMFYDSPTAADFKMAMTWPAGVTLARWGLHGPATGVASTTGDGQFGVATVSGTAIATGSAGAGTANTVMTVAKGTLTMGGTAGNLTVQYAQNTADAGNTIPRAGCRLQVWRVA